MPDRSIRTPAAERAKALFHSSERERHQVPARSASDLYRRCPCTRRHAYLARLATGFPPGSRRLQTKPLKELTAATCPLKDA